MEILFEDDDMLVVLKPENIASESANIRQKDIYSMVRDYLKGGYAAMINRLDQPVRGIILFAKNERAAATLSGSITSGESEKYYIAVVDGMWNDKSGQGELVNYLSKDKKNNRAVIADPNEKAAGNSAKKAVLEYKVLKYDTDKKRTILKIRLHTGRFHQIRCQLSAAGHPIVNDVKYGYCGEKDSDYKGIALCAYRLAIPHPKSKKKMNFEIEPFNLTQDMIQ